MFRRTTAVFAATALLGLWGAPRAAHGARKASAKIRRNFVSLHNLKSGKKLDNMRVIWQNPKNTDDKQICGKYGPNMQAKYGWKTRFPPRCGDARGKIAKMLRDRKTGEPFKGDKGEIDKLIWYLYLVGNKFQKPIQIVSGRRASARLTSRHNKGLAVDFRVPGVDPKDVWEYCKSKDNLIRRGVGLGYYPTSKFVHIDTRSCPDKRVKGKACVKNKSHFWIDDSGPGQASKYRKGVKQPRWHWKEMAVDKRRKEQKAKREADKQSKQKKAKRARTDKRRKEKKAKRKAAKQSKEKKAKRADKLRKEKEAKRKAAKRGKGPKTDKGEGHKASKEGGDSRRATPMKQGLARR